MVALNYLNSSTLNHAYAGTISWLSGSLWPHCPTQVLRHEGFLKYSSPVFEDMFSVPKSVDDARYEEEKRLSHINMVESSKFLRSLLILCYPRQTPLQTPHWIDEEIASRFWRPTARFRSVITPRLGGTGRESNKSFPSAKAADLPMPVDDAYDWHGRLSSLFNTASNVHEASDWVRVNINNYKCVKYEGDQDYYMFEESFCWWALPGETLQSEGHNPKMKHACKEDTVWTPASFQKNEKIMNISGRRRWIRYFFLLEELNCRACSEIIMDCDDWLIQPSDNWTVMSASQLPVKIYRHF